jgi:hypothetical protein
MRCFVVSAAVVLLGSIAVESRAVAAGPEEPYVTRGVAYLKARAPKAGVGECALATLALIKAEVPPNDPAMGACLSRILGAFNGNEFIPGRSGGLEIYEASVVCLVFCNLDPIGFKPQIDILTQWLVGRQLPNGSWDYTHRSAGDTSITQYAILGLWEAENAGANVPPAVWDRAARWFLSAQHGNGAWNYHNDEPSWQETISMTAAGVGSLLICKRQLARFRRAADASSVLLVPVLAEGAAAPFVPETSAGSINTGVTRGKAWLQANFTTTEGPSMGQTPYYGMYGLERVVGLSEGDASLSKLYERGQQFIFSTQRSDGTWKATYDEVPNTSWALLYITKATAKSVRRIEIKRLGAGRLIGGKGLPKDLSSLDIAGGRILVRPMNGAVEGMLAVLEDPRSQNADSALAGLVDRYQTEGPKVLRPHKDRFRKLLTDKDAGVRRVAAWALGRSADLDVAPDLIAALLDADDGVVAESKTGLQLLSRKIEGYGPNPGASADEKQAALKKWRAWLDEARPPDVAGPEDGSNPRRSVLGGQR